MPDAPKKYTAHILAPDGWTPSDKALFVVLTDWCGAALGRAWRERDIKPDADTLAEIDAIMAGCCIAFVEEVRGGMKLGPRQPREIVADFATHILVEYFGSPEDRRREFRVLN